MNVYREKSRAYFFPINLTPANKPLSCQEIDLNSFPLLETFSLNNSLGYDYIVISEIIQDSVIVIANLSIPFTSCQLSTARSMIMSEASIILTRSLGKRYE